jgi:hypothetical protein
MQTNLLMASMVAALGMDMTREFLSVPPAPPKPKEKTPEDLRKIAAAQAKRERKLLAKQKHDRYHIRAMP